MESWQTKTEGKQCPRVEETKECDKTDVTLADKLCKTVGVESDAFKECSEKLDIGVQEDFINK